MTEQRRLAAIVAADVVGYSRLMERDESGTLARLREHRKQRFEPALARHHGRLVKLMGDGALVEFPSVVDALTAAIEFQQAMAEANVASPADSAIVFRVGLHLGDLIVDGDDLYGDGVNVAARLEQEAPPGGVVVSRAVREAVQGRVKATLQALGDLSVKNIERPIRAFRVEWSPEDWPPPSGAGRLASEAIPPILPLPDKPSIAVLPFQSMSADPEQEYFADGMVEDIITALSRFKSLFVIARNSSFAYKGKAVDIKQVGRELGVRYVLEGSVRKAADRLRVTAQLIDAASGSHIWAERYDRRLEDVFAVQEDLTSAIVGAIAPQIESTEKIAALRRAPANLTAYDLAVRARGRVWEGFEKADPALIDSAIAEARAAIAIDPTSVLSQFAISHAYGVQLFLQWAGDREGMVREVMAAAGRAIELDPADAAGYAIRALGVFMGGMVERYDGALADARRAHQANPNDTFILYTLAHLETRMGEADRALERAALILRLNPRGERMGNIYNLFSFASFAARKYADGVDWAQRALHEMPGMIPTHSNLIICLVGMGQIDRARTAFATANALAPEYFRVRLEGRSMYHQPQDRERQIQFLRVAAGQLQPSAVDSLR